MRFVIENQIKANKREIPGNLPPGVWANKIGEYRSQPDLLVKIPWHHQDLEYLSPLGLARTRAKALIWFEVTGEWPTDIAHWGDIRIAREAGYLPHTTERVMGHIDDDGTLHCGHCGARWTDPHPDRCKLCDRRITPIK